MIVTIVMGTGQGNEQISGLYRPAIDRNTGGDPLFCCRSAGHPLRPRLRLRSINPSRCFLHGPAGFHGIIEGKHLIPDDLAGFVALTGQNQHIAGFQFETAVQMA